MEIEKDEDYSTCSEYETDSKSINNINEPINKPINNFISEIYSLKYKTYQEQFIALFKKYNLDINSLDKLIINFANLLNTNNSKIEMNINNYIHYSEKLIIKIYNIQYYLKEKRIDELINEIKSVNEKLLSNNLLFILHLQKLLHLIENNLVKDSLMYAQKYLIPLTENNDELYKKLGNVVSLLAYDNIKDCPYKDIITVDEHIDNINDKIISMLLEFLLKIKY